MIILVSLVQKLLLRVAIRVWGHLWGQEMLLLMITSLLQQIVVIPGCMDVEVDGTKGPEVLAVQLILLIQILREFFPCCSAVILGIGIHRIIFSERHWHKDLPLPMRGVVGHT